jgi:hypothetical protein
MHQQTHIFSACMAIIVVVILSDLIFSCSFDFHIGGFLDVWQQGSSRGGGGGGGGRLFTEVVEEQ